MCFSLHIRGIHSFSKISSSQWKVREPAMIHLQVNNKFYSWPDKKLVNSLCLKIFGNSPRLLPGMDQKTTYPLHWRPRCSAWFSDDRRPVKERGHEQRTHTVPVHILPSSWAFKWASRPFSAILWISSVFVVMFPFSFLILIIWMFSLSAFWLILIRFCLSYWFFSKY